MANLNRSLSELCLGNLAGFTVEWSDFCYVALSAGQGENKLAGEAASKVKVERMIRRLGQDLQDNSADKASLSQAEQLEFNPQGPHVRKNCLAHVIFWPLYVHRYVHSLFSKRNKWFEEVAQGLRVIAVLAKDLNLVPGTHVRYLITQLNFSSRGSNTHLCPLGDLYTCTHTYTHHTHPHSHPHPPHIHILHSSE